MSDKCQQCQKSLRTANEKSRIRRRTWQLDQTILLCNDCADYTMHGRDGSQWEQVSLKYSPKRQGV